MLCPGFWARKHPSSLPKLRMSDWHLCPTHPTVEKSIVLIWNLRTLSHLEYYAVIELNMYKRPDSNYGECLGIDIERVRFSVIDSIDGLLRAQVQMNNDLSSLLCWCKALVEGITR